MDRLSESAAAPWTDDEIEAMREQSGSGDARWLATVDGLRARMREILEVGLVSAGPGEDGSFEIRVAGELVKVIAGSMIEFFDEAGGINYVECEVRDAKRGSFVMRIQRKDGKSPHELRVEAESARDVALNALWMAVRNMRAHFDLVGDRVDHFLMCATPGVRVRLGRAVGSDVGCLDPVTAEPGEYEPRINAQGAVSIVLPDGKELGLRPGEFEWISPESNRDGQD